MTLDEHARVYRNAQFVAEASDPFRFMQTAAIGEEDEGDALQLKVGECFLRARERV
jgi:hypothetical protein